MKVSKKTTDKVLAITQKTFEEFKDKLIVTRPTLRLEDGTSLKEFVELGINDPEKKLDLPEEEINKLKTYLKSGVLDETEEVPDWEVAKEYEEELDKRLLEAIEKGELPKYTLTFLKKKTRKYVRKSQGDSK